MITHITGLPTMAAHILVPLLVLLPALVIVDLLRTYFRRHLYSIPGPFINSLTSVPRLLSVAYGHHHLDTIALHCRYGPLVRIGPNHVSFTSDTEALSTVYSISSRFEKSDFYLPFDAKTAHGMVPTVFSVRSERAHKDIKRPIAGAYSMTTLLELESLTDDCISTFQTKIDEKLATAAKRDSQESIVMNLGDWLHWYAFDLITSITFSNRLGFMTSESDVEGIIAAIEGRLRYNATIGQMPWLHQYLLGNKLMSWLATFIPSIAKMNTAKRIVDFTARQLDRYAGKDQDLGYADMLDRFKRVSASRKAQMSDTDLLAAAVGNIFAGSDTTAISLRSMFYYLIKNPICMGKLLKEIDEKDAKGELREIVTFAESQNMPYLQACMKEAMRLHPAVGMMLERVVPEDGVTIAGHFIPAGTVIGANPWVVARDKEVYGDDVDEFRPERWLELWQKAEKEGQDSNAAEKVKRMERSFLAFGMGSRSCLGKNVSLLEMNKLVPQLLRRYKIEMDRPDREWRMEDYWFVKQLDVICTIRKR